MINIERLSNQVSELLHKDVAQQWRGVHLYMEKIRGEVGDVLDGCRWLIDCNTVLSLDDFHNDVLTFKGGKEGNNIVIISFWLLTHHYESIKEHESHPDGSQGLPSRYYDVESTFHYQLCREVWGMLPDDVRASEVDEYHRLIKTCEYRGSLFLRYVLLTYLYIALNNECESIKEQAQIEGVTLPSSPEIAPRLPHNERKEHGGTIIPPSNNLTLDEQEAVFTERALRYFEMAIDKGYMELTPSHYKWLYGGKRGKVRCGVFLLRVYCPNNTEKLPERALHKLFGMERLDSVITGFNLTNHTQRWLPYIDEMFDD